MRKMIFIAAGVILASAAICFFMLNDSHDGQAEGMKADIIRCFKENYNITPDKGTVETLYAVFSTADEITGHKLTAAEMIRMFSFIGAAVTGRNSALNEDMSRNMFMLRDNPMSHVSPVKTAYFLLSNESILHAQKLGGKEKLDCAFLFSYLAEHAKDGSKNIYPIEKFRDLMRAEQENNPADFAFFEREMKMDMSSADFAVTRENPVRTVSIGHSSGYLARLRTASGGDVHYVRRGSGPSFDGKGIVDIYSLSFSDGSGDKTMTIYIDPYCAEISRKAPEGLVLRMP